MAQRMTFGLFSGATSQRIEFVRMKGPRGIFIILINSLLLSNNFFSLQDLCVSCSFFFFVLCF